MEDAHRILVVDDELGPREALRMILKSQYQVLTADNGIRDDTSIEQLTSTQAGLKQSAAKPRRYRTSRRSPSCPSST